MNLGDNLSEIATGRAVALARDGEHRFSKQICDSLTLLEGEGIMDDAHCGMTVQHRSRVARDPDQPNLRQVHLIHQELLDELQLSGFDIKAGEMGENILTDGVDLLALPTGTLLHIGDTVLRVTGLRNPCKQLDEFRPGLMKAVLDRGQAGDLIRKAGVMAIVLLGGEISTGDGIRVELPPQPFKPLEPV